MSHIMIENVTKKYGDYKAVNDANLAIGEGELFTLLGPSGCGKTTLLRMIAGFNSIDGGTISINQQVINQLPAHKRNIGMVFQNYAIFPHMSVYKNVAYGLKARKINKKEIKQRVEQALEMVKMLEYQDRQPSQLSGGQQQRIALARAIVIHPQVLLMDEPLSNLDAKLRVEMRSVIRRLQKELKITTIYVTHDQEEALAISDRIAVMKLGVIQQVGTPENIYKNPKNIFVGDFIGTSNFLEAQVDASGTKMELYNSLIQTDKSLIAGQKIIVSARPEEILLRPKSETGIKGKIVMDTFLGDFINYEVELADGKVIEVNEYTKDATVKYQIGDQVEVQLMEDKIHVYSHTGEEEIV